MSKQVCLTVAHNIFLTREQRYALVNGETVNTTGVSVPVWFKDSKTNEPAQEIFCVYIIEPQHQESNVVTLNDGYCIWLNSEKLSKKLRDVSDGGSESVMFTLRKDFKEKHMSLHYVSIHDMKVLEKSLV